VLVALLAAGETAARQYLTRQRSAHTGRIRELTKTKLDLAGSVRESLDTRTAK